jgi:uncharacterized protein YkwD
VERVRSTVAILALLGALVAAPALAGTSSPTRARSVQRAELTSRSGLDLGILYVINSIRVSHGLARLRLDPSLRASAALHSREMAKTGLFQHTSPNGSPFWKRIARYYGYTGFNIWDVGENLLWWSPDTTADHAVSAWMASPPHRKILLDPRYRQIGIAAIHDTIAPGAFQDREAIIVTADFGVRAR